MGCSLVDDVAMSNASVAATRDTCLSRDVVVRWCHDHYGNHCARQ